MNKGTQKIKKLNIETVNYIKYGLFKQYDAIN